MTPFFAWKFFPSLCISISPQPTIQHLPHPLATSAACDVIPPLVVSIACDLCIPSTSSGEVSSLTRITFSPLAAHATASAEENTTRPLAPPGPAGKPLAITGAVSSALGSSMGSNNSTNWFGPTLIMAVFASISFSLCISVAIRTAATPFLLPTLHCNIKSFPFSMVNSMSCISL